MKSGALSSTATIARVGGHNCEPNQSQVCEPSGSSPAIVGCGLHCALGEPPCERATMIDGALRIAGLHRSKVAPTFMRNSGALIGLVGFRQVRPGLAVASNRRQAAN